MSGAAMAFERVAVGDVLPEARVEFTRESVMAYAAAGGDHNRIHWDDEYAREVALPGVIAHGMFTMASASSVVENWVGSAGFVSAYRVKFTDLVPVPYSGSAGVDVSGTVKSVDEESRSAVVELKVTHGDAKVLGNARCTVQWR